MNHKDFGKRAPGKLVPITGYDRRARDGMAVLVPVATKSFVPDRLPPHAIERDAFIGRVSDELLAAQSALSLLEGMVATLPNPGLLIHPFRMREATLSSRIENTVASIEELALHEVGKPAERDEVREVHNYLKALEHGLASTLPLTNRLFREMHAILMEGVRGHDKRRGEFRDRPVCIGDELRGFAQARFVPPPPGEHMDRCLKDFEAYLNGVDTSVSVTARMNSPMERYPRLIEVAFAHYQFEAIHPFSDGNGRLGRLLVAVSACRHGMLTRPLLYVSAYFEQHRQEYYDLLLQMSTRGEWEAWTRFFCTAVATQARDAVQRAGRLLELRKSYLDRVMTKRTSALTSRLVDLLFEWPAVRASTVVKKLGITAPSAQKHIDALVKHGVLQEVTGGSYGRLYVARGITRAAEEDDFENPANEHPN